MAVADRVAQNLPETAATIQSASSWWDDAVTANVADTLSRVFPHNPQPVVEADLGLTPFQESYLADLVTRLMIPPAIDYYMVRTGRQDSIQGVPAGQDARSQRTSGPGTGRSNYARVAALKDLDQMLAARLAADLAEFEDSFGGDSNPAGLMISTWGQPLLSRDPLTMPMIDRRRIVSITAEDIIVTSDPDVNAW